MRRAETLEEFTASIDRLREDLIPARDYLHKVTSEREQAEEATKQALAQRNQERKCRQDQNIDLERLTRELSVERGRDQRTDAEHKLITRLRKERQDQNQDLERLSRELAVERGGAQQFATERDEAQERLAHAREALENQRERNHSLQATADSVKRIDAQRDTAMSALADMSVVKNRFGAERDEARKELADERESRKAHHAELRDTIAWWEDAAQHHASLYMAERKAREAREAQEAN